MQSQIIIERVVLDWFRSGNCKLKTVERMVLMVLSRYCDRHTLVAWPSQAKIAIACGVTRGTVNKCVKQLVDKGVITAIKSDDKVTQTYSLRPFLDVYEPDTAPVLQGYTPPVRSGHTNGAGMNGARNGNITGRMVIPTPEEVQAYLDEAEITSFTGQEFFDANETKGWVTGKPNAQGVCAPMRNWKSACRTWARNRKTWGSDDDYHRRDLDEVRREEANG